MHVKGNFLFLVVSIVSGRDTAKVLNPREHSQKVLRGTKDRMKETNRDLQLVNTCCDPNLLPSCVSGDPACCPEGSWVCPDADTKEYPCADGSTNEPNGTVCEGAIPIAAPLLFTGTGGPCCDANNQTICDVGEAMCCPEGSWACPEADTKEYACADGLSAEPSGTICDLYPIYYALGGGGGGGVPSQDTCCDPGVKIDCLAGQAACCLEGSWVCPNKETKEYPCMDGSIAEPNGTICEEPIFLEDGGPLTCCDTATEPGKNNNQICKEGYACCPDGTWSCSIGDGKTFPCGGVLVENPVGTVCDTGGSNCCDPTIPLRCLIGQPACCPEGSWACPNGDTNKYPCADGPITEPAGPICDHNQYVTNTAGDSCCDPNLPSLCKEGQAMCCPNGSWICPGVTTGTYNCEGEVFVKDPKGPICGREPKKTFRYQKPEWYQRIEKEGINVPRLKMCMKRDFPPGGGLPCSRKPKTCFFGEQTCPNVGSHPTTVCICDGHTWHCEREPCPEQFEP